MKHINLLILTLAALIVAACGGGGSGSDAAPSAVALPTLSLPTVPTPAYKEVGSGPLVILLTGDMEDAVSNNSTSDGVLSDLLGAGYTVLSMDLPCHGADADPLYPDPLACWAARVKSGDTMMFLNFCAGLSDVLDSLDVKSASVIGLSRGAYMAITCAAYDPRIQQLGLLIPLIDLSTLSEFDGITVDQSVYGLGQYAPYLQGRPSLIDIGANDPRVTTPPALAYGKDIGSVMDITSTTEHYVPDPSYVVSWLSASLKQ